MKFFVVHTYTGREKKVKELLEKAIKSQGKEALFGRVILPAEKVARVRKSKIVTEERRLYPGYIVVEMEPVEEALKLVTSIPGVTHILGTKQQPLALSEDEVAAICEQMEKGRDQVEPEAPFEKGETVKVTKGPFAGFTGTVEEIIPERRRVKVMVTIFGRPTPIDLDFLEVQPI
ncbi:MAG: transcription termination/antitermination protein NusG [candidate division WOR-3 bacterium]|jgi:transcriptional antiterminator NusG